jgi:hypothetical protein
VKVGFLPWLCILALAASAGEVRAASDEYVEYSGIASVRHKPEFLYGERHILHYHEARLIERTVLYSCANGSLFARKRVTYVDDEAPDFFFDDVSNGMQEGVRSEGAARTMFFKANRTAAEKSAPLPRVQDLVADAGFDNFIPEHWNALMRGAAVPLPFLVISRLQVMNFEVQHLRADQFDGRPTEVFRMKLSGVLGLLFSGIEVTYDAADRRLVHYDGLSDLRGASGDNLQADIVFHRADRKPSSAQAFAAAQAVPLAPCPN